YGCRDSELCYSENPYRQREKYRKGGPQVVKDRIADKPNLWRFTDEETASDAVHRKNIIEIPTTVECRFIDILQINQTNHKKY
ncbi:MAG: hypothetical protein VX075_13470, partial [Pseudomonadota bacterium]|nr:hypothetical protein [Pseudomonadota bacterium]